MAVTIGQEHSHHCQYQQIAYRCTTSKFYLLYAVLQR